MITRYFRVFTLATKFLNYGINRLFGVGGLFLYFYNSQERNKGSLLLASVSISYILKLVYDKSIMVVAKNCISYNSAYYYIGLVLFSIVLGYLLGIFTLSKPFGSLIQKLNIPHSVNSNFWLDIYKQGTWLNVF